MAAGTYTEMTRIAYGATEMVARSSARIAVQTDIRTAGYTPVGPPTVKTLSYCQERGWSASAVQQGRKPKES